MAFPPIRNVAVIGAGVSGITSAAHLLRQGLNVTLFERSSISGGVWHFDENTASEPTYPNETPSKGDFTKTSEEKADGEVVYLTPPQTPEHEDEANRDDRQTDWSSQQINKSAKNIKIRVDHAPPGPCYAGLRNNVPLTLMKTSLAEWPAGLEEIVSQKYLEEYIQYIAQSTGVNEVTAYNTRVDDVRKLGETWKIRSVTLNDSEPAGLRVAQRVWDFDAVVVASGHYHMPRIPDIPGLQEWKRRFPDRVGHSKRYRRADDYRGQNVLLLGAGTSSADIAKELGVVGNHTYQSSRGGTFDYPASSLPENGTRVGGISSFDLADDQNTDTALSEGEHIPGSITLHNGQKLCNIDHVILCTGYVTSYPFLPQYHDDVRYATAVDTHILVTKEGNMVHNLHQEIWHIEDPTLAFVGVPYHIATFSLFDFQAQAVARVFAGKATLPPQPERRRLYVERVERKGLGREFHSLRANGAEPEYVRSLVELVNEGAEKGGFEPMQGHTEVWFEAYRAMKKYIEERIGLRLAEAKAEPNKFDDVTLTGPGVC